ncbi:Rho-type GTPase-activating protein, partial [Podila epigama]
MHGSFVRALGATYHLDCFKCLDCKQIAASKFFPIKEVDGKQYPLCERDYFRRLNLLCYNCGEALRGSYITALENKYHLDHFSCSICPTVFGPQDSYYEHDSKVYCHYHYSIYYAVKCAGCQTAILKQFVEINRNGLDEHWHPECYMIHKFWNVKLSTATVAKTKDEPQHVSPRPALEDTNEALSTGGSKPTKRASPTIVEATEGATTPKNTTTKEDTIADETKVSTLSASTVATSTAA